jgi:hypothetical protein
MTIPQEAESMKKTLILSSLALAALAGCHHSAKNGNGGGHEMIKLRKNVIQRTSHGGRDERRVSDRSRTLTPFGATFNALKPLIA